MDEGTNPLENYRYKCSYYGKINLLFTEMVMLTKTTKVSETIDDNIKVDTIIPLIS